MTARMTTRTGAPSSFFSSSHSIFWPRKGSCSPASVRLKACGLCIAGQKGHPRQFRVPEARTTRNCDSCLLTIRGSPDLDFPCVENRQQCAFFLSICASSTRNSRSPGSRFRFWGQGFQRWCRRTTTVRHDTCRPVLSMMANGTDAVRQCPYARNVDIFTVPLASATFVYRLKLSLPMFMLPGYIATFTCTYIHACIRTYIHAFIHSFIHAHWVHTQICNTAHTFNKRSSKHAYLHTCSHPFVHSFIHIDVHTGYTHNICNACTRACVQTARQADRQTDS